MNPNEYYQFSPPPEAQNTYATHFKVALIVLYILVIAFAIWQIVPAVNTFRHTGILQVTTSATNTQISISEENHQAINIGTGAAKVRLQPGTYQVAGFSNGAYATQIIAISQGKTTYTSLNINPVNSSTQRPRTVEDVNFVGTDAIMSYGLSSEQINEMEQYFFQFKPTEKTVTINASSITSGSRNPNIISPFSLTFTVSVDDITYNATVTYYDTNNLVLTLNTIQTGAQVFTAGSISPPSSQ